MIRDFFNDIDENGQTPYMLGLQCGAVFMFHGATVNGDCIELRKASSPAASGWQIQTVHVQLAAVQWVAEVSR